MGNPIWRSFFFFFQAEDGIRDADVTGVQTCALPISIAARDGELDCDALSLQSLPVHDATVVLRSGAPATGRHQQRARGGRVPSEIAYHRSHPPRPGFMLVFARFVRELLRNGSARGGPLPAPGRASALRCYGLFAGLTRRMPQMPPSNANDA